MSIYWRITHPFLHSPWTRPQEIHPIRDLLLLFTLVCILVLTFKQEINLARKKGWAAWHEMATDIIEELTHPL